MKVIPAIDVHQGKCVRLLHGDFSKATKYSDDPLQIGQQFSDLAVTDLHLVDLDGARDGVSANFDLIHALATATHMQVQVGGGIRERDDLSRWFDCGITRCVVGSVAIESPARVNRWLQEFGEDRIVVALDVRFDAAGVPRPTTHGWTSDSPVSLWQLLEQYPGTQQVLCTDVSRDGAMSGPSEALYGQILERYPQLELQASGGVRDIADLHALRRLGCPAAITGRALLDGTITAEEIRSFQQNA